MSGSSRSGTSRSSDDRIGMGLACPRPGAAAGVTAFAFPSPEVTQCPYAFYEALRQDAPVYKHPERNEYLLARRQDILHVFHHPEIFSSDLAVGDERFRQEVSDFASETRNDGDGEGERPILTSSSLVFSDPPDHTVKRRALALAFTRERMADYEPLIEAIANELIDGFEPDGEVEFRGQFADQLAVRTICAVAGFPDEARTLVLQWARVGSRHGRRFMTTEQLAEQDRSLEHQAAFVQGLIADRLESPRDDFLTELVHGQVERDGALNLEYLMNDVNLLLAAGNETTSRLITNTMLLLLQSPETMQHVVDDPSLVPAALEESLRYESPTQWISRYVTRDTAIDGISIPEGAFVVLLLGSANHEESQWDDPNRFVLGREDIVKYNMAFGGGIHLCVGAPLARLESRIGMRVALQRLQNLRLAPGRNDFANIDNFQKRVPQVLHLVFDRAV